MKNADRIKLEMVAKSLDTIRVHNPTSEDFVIWNNRSQTNNIPAQKWVIPNVNKDVGYGKGNLDMPRFAAEKYLSYMSVEIINKKWEVVWKKIKKDYKEHEWEKVEPRLAPKTNDPTLLKEILPTLWVGLVHEQEIPEDSLETEPVQSRKSGLDGILASMGLDQKVVDTNKDQFAEAITDEPAT